MYCRYIAFILSTCLSVSYVFTCETVSIVLKFDHGLQPTFSSAAPEEFYELCSSTCFILYMYTSQRPCELGVMSNAIVFRECYRDHMQLDQCNEQKKLVRPTTTWGIWVSLVVQQLSPRRPPLRLWITEPSPPRRLLICSSRPHLSSGERRG